MKEEKNDRDSRNSGITDDKTSQNHISLFNCYSYLVFFCLLACLFVVGNFATTIVIFGNDVVVIVSFITTVCCLSFFSFTLIVVIIY